MHFRNCEIFLGTQFIDMIFCTENVSSEIYFPFIFHAEVFLIWCGGCFFFFMEENFLAEAYLEDWFS